jgi:S-adenosylmethionine:tRNA ribosyltransferase-isomerase
MNLSDYNYDLPESLIAKTPCQKRDQSRLMVLDSDLASVTHHHFTDILQFINAGDVLVLNNTKVIKARLYAKKETGGALEILLERQLSEHQFTALVKPAKRVRVGDQIYLSEDTALSVMAKEDGIITLEFPNSDCVFDILDRYGHMPIPPYIKSGDETPESFKAEYQTVFASQPGAVAAPTAGLHFTPELLNALKDKGVQIETVTLHVGYGTFQPIKVDDFKTHTMHSERYNVSAETAERLNTAKSENRRIIAVGTTSVRTLEAATQNDSVRAGSGETTIFIYPGYDFKTVDGLITNFHLPKSSLLLLVSALTSRDFMMRAYEQAIKDHYRFFSFGDAMFILPKSRNI